MNYSIFIGRFQPFHNGHLNACEQALHRSGHIIILVGSAFSSRNIKNPFSWEERRSMISSALDAKKYNGQYTILPIRDYFYSDNAWVANIQKKVETIIGPTDKVFLCGRDKDATTYYLNLFPQWDFMPIMVDFPVDATGVRRAYFSEKLAGDFKSTFKEDRLAPINVPKSTLQFLKKFSKTKEYIRMREEASFIKKYKEDWSSAPYAPVFVTTDAVVVCGGHVLLVRRRDNPGKGLYALPGGFIQPDEPLEKGCLRELKEETRINVPKAVLTGCIKAKRVFDHPFRSLRGRTITHAFYIELNEKKLPKVKGEDDADKAFWLPLNEVINNMNKFYEDHFQIIESFIGKI